MKYRKLSSANLAAVSAVIWAFGGQLTIAGAQSSTDANDVVLEEILVTARMRQESLQEVPMSVTAFTALDIEAAGIETAQDFLSLTSNVSLVEANSAGESFLTIRGLTQVRNNEMPVAVVVDGVLLSNPRQFTQDFYDIERIEVLKGPQGALYGRNAIGGAINISTKQPGDDLAGSVLARIGNESLTQIQASASGPVSDNGLYFTAGANYRDFDGFYDNITTGQNVDYRKDKSVRGKLVWNASDRPTVDLRGYYSDVTGGGVNWRAQTTGFPGSSNPSTWVNPTGADLITPRFSANNPGKTEREITEFSGRVVWEFDAGKFAMILGYNAVQEYWEGDQFPYTADTTFLFAPGVGVDGTQTQWRDVDQFSQEIRFTSSDDQAVRWFAGVYFLQTDAFISTTTGDDRGLGIRRIERDPLFNDASNPTFSFLADDSDNSAWAAFAQVSFDLSDNVELSSALRYDEDEREQYVSPDNTLGAPGITNKVTFDKLQPKVTIRYIPGERLTVYGSYGEGFRSGVFNSNGIGGQAAALGIAGVLDVADQEESKNLELGFKSRLANNRVGFGGAVFQTEVTGQQYFVFIPETGSQVLVNINEVTLTGIELELQAALSENLDAYLSYGYTDSEIDSYDTNPTAVGNRAPYIPENTVNAGFRWTQSISDSMNFFVNMDYENRGKQFWSPENTDPRSALDFVNLRLGLKGQSWSVVGWAKNLFDEKFNSEYVAGGFAHIGPRRLFGLELKYQY